MKKVLSLLSIVLALGSCQSDNSPTQADPSADQIGVAARLVSTKALPQAQFFRARLTVGSVVGDWVDAAYTRGAELVLGKVKRGTIVVLDVRGYSVDGKDTLWKWFARKSDSATGSVLTIEAEVKGVEVAAPAVGQVLKVPVGSWYTTDTTSWANKASVDSTGTIPALSGTVLLVRLRMAVPGASDTLLGEVLRYVLPRKPTLLPTNRALNVSDSVKITGASGDSLVFCEGAGCTNWAPYKKAFARKAFVLRAHALRNGLVSPVEEASFTLAPADTTPVQPIDSVVGKPSISPNAGTLAMTDSVRIAPAKTGDSMRYTIDEGKNWSVYTRPIIAGAFTVAAVSHRGRFHSDTVKATFTVNKDKPSSPTIKSNCDVAGDCDPGMTVELSTTDTGVTLQYALLADTSNWKTYAKFPLSTSTKVFARAVRRNDTSAVQTATFVVVQPDTVRFTSVRHTKDTTWVKLAAKSGTIWFSKNASRDSSKWTSSDSLPVRASDSLFAWTWRGTARSATKSYHAQAATPDSVGMPSISPNPGAVASSEFISISPARPGDSIRYTTNGTEWFFYTAPFKSGAFTVRAFAFRGGILSDTASATYTLSATKPSSPSFAYTCANDVCDPGVSIGISSTDTGVTLQYALAPDSTKWIEGNRFPLNSSNKVYARAVRKTDASAIRSATITIAQPDTVVFDKARRNPDTVWVKLSTTSGTIWYSRGAAKDSARYSDSIAVRVLDSLRAWSVRGTAKSDAKTFHASPVKPSKPTISSPTDSVIAPRDSILIDPATSGDTLQYNIGGGWLDYKGRVAPGTGGPFVISARAKRNGLVSDTVMKTYAVDTAALRTPWITPSIDGKSDPGTQFTISVDSGSTLEWTYDKTKTWYAVASPLKFTANRDTTIYARAKTTKKTSSTQTFAIGIQQPDTVTFAEVLRTPDSVKLSIVAVDGDLVVYSRNAESVNKTAATPGTATIMVRVKDSITAWTVRGTATGAKRGYKVVAVAPKPPSISPNGGHVHDTTDVVVAASAVGDSIYYKIGTLGTWTPYSTRLPPLSVGNVTLFARSIRNGLSADTSAVFTVHAKPDTVTFNGCTTNCNPGDRLILKAKVGYGVQVKEGVSNYSLTTSPDTIVLDQGETVCAYADSAGHASKEVCVDVTVTQPVAPTITAVNVMRTSTADTASVVVKATQVGDTLMATRGSISLGSFAVTSTSFVKSFGVRRTATPSDSVVTIWTKRGTASSSPVKYTLSRLPQPIAPFKDSSTWVVGKNRFQFSRDLAKGALASDTILISTNSGASWSKKDTLGVDGKTAGTVWARTIRKGFQGVADSSVIWKGSYKFDSAIVTELFLEKGSDQTTRKFFKDTGIAVLPIFRMTVEPTVETVRTYLGSNFYADIGSIQYICENCDTSSGMVSWQDFPHATGTPITLNPYGITKLKFTIKMTWGYTRTYRIWVNRTAPWNPDITFDSLQDARDGIVYKTVSINGKTWMAENLKYKGTTAKPVGVCRFYMDYACDEFGGYYTWSEAMNLPSSCDAASCGSQVVANHRGICPDGYHVPTTGEWKTILGATPEITSIDTLGSESLARKLRSSSYWYDGWWNNGLGPFDVLGFRALPAGKKAAPGWVNFQASTGWWAAQEIDPYSSNYELAEQFMVARYAETADSLVGRADMGFDFKDQATAIRCVK